MAGAPFSEDDLLDYVRGAASPELSGRIEEMAAGDPAFKAEIALMRGLGPALRDGDASQTPTEFGWRRVEAAIRRERAGQRAVPSRRQMVIWRVAAVFLGIAVLGQAGYITSLPTTVEEPVYRTASGATEEYVLGIAFAPDATAAEIGNLLRNAEASVIDGPSALGLYRVAFASEEALRDGRTQFGTSPLIDLIAEE